jgi:ribosomal protein L28
MKCELCGKVLVPIGTSRKNGKSHRDWNTRQYHKKCWIAVSERSRILEEIEQYKKDKLK